MELKYLKTFRVIVEEGSFSAAAEKLNYTQSAITFQIGQLEKETGTRLFEKVGRRMILTSAGRAFIPYVNQVLEAVEHLEYFQEEMQECAGELKIGVAESFLCYRLPQVLGEAALKAPKAKLMIRSMNCYDIRDELLDGTLDIGLFYQDVGGNMENLNLTPLASYPVSMIASKHLAEDIPGLTERGISYPFPFLINEKNCIFRQIFEKYLEEHDISMSHTIELGSIETIKNLVQHDVGVSFLPRFTVEKEIARGSVTEIETNVSQNHITMALGYHKNKWISPLMKMFLEHISGYDFR